MITPQKILIQTTILFALFLSPHPAPADPEEPYYPSVDFSIEEGISNLAPPTKPAPPSIGANEIRSFTVVSASDNEVEIEVDAFYDPQGEDWANLSISFYEDGEPLGSFGTCPAQLVPGQNKARLGARLIENAPDQFNSDEIKITMYRKKGYEFLPDLAERTFPYKKSWQRPNAEPQVPPDPNAGDGPGYARIGQVRVIKDTNDTLELEVQYVYDPQRSRFAELDAGTYLHPGSPNHDKRFSVKLTPGFNNTAIYKIERSSQAPAEYKTDRINVVISGTYLSNKPGDRMQTRETFVYPKTWSQYPIYGGPVLPEEGNVLIREKDAPKEQVGAE